MRSSHSFVVLLSSFLLQLSSGMPQVSPPPALLQSLEGPAQEPTTTAGRTCGGCVIVADVVGIVWYEQVFINTAATAFVGVGVGNNGSRVTRTSIVQNDAEFTFNPQASAQYGTVMVTNAAFLTSTEIAGATLTSPTAYNVFTAYTYTTQLQLANGQCSTTSTVVTLTSAYTETLATASGRVYLDEGGQRGFIEALGFSTCTGGGENYVNTALVQVSDLTVSTTSTYSGVALAAMSTTFAPSPTSRAPVRTTTLTDVLTTLTATLEGSSTITAAPAPSAEVPEIVIGNSTITPNPTPLTLPFFTATVAATGTGAGTGGNGTVPFINNAPIWGSGAAIGGSALLMFVMAVGWVS
ncbi:MAG: hypothetical protein L6R38_002823 [Xanthoria sp. 2 TBL-2021]|nr:MAG: hypothetical protein L6R38_002823 [Xanthoria sp. 2 TBL-2021]